jgi:hypothetical protein
MNCDPVLPTFGQHATDPVERWGLLRKFATKWQGVSFPRVDEGALVEAVEERTGRSLPVSVREWVAFSAQHGAGSFNLMRDDLRIENLLGTDALGLICICEGNCFWGVQATHLHLPDPPVTVFGTQDETEESFWVGPWKPLDIERHTLTSWMLSYLSHAFRREGGDMSTSISAGEIQELNLDDYFEVSDAWEDVSVFESPDIFLVLERDWDPEDMRISLKCARPFLPSELPGWVEAMTKRGGSFSGPFVELLKASR